MIKRTFFSLIIFGIIFSFNNIDGHDVLQNSIIIKFENSFAPKLGKESPINLKQLRSITDVLNNLEIVEFRTLHRKFENFDQLEYKHSLHQI